MKQKIANIYLEQSDKPITNYCCLVIETKSGECFKIEGVYKVSEKVIDTIISTVPQHLEVSEQLKKDFQQKPNKKKVKASSLFT